MLVGLCVYYFSTWLITQLCCNHIFYNVALFYSAIGIFRIWLYCNVDVHYLILSNCASDKYSYL
jgi:hypothetical protein